MADLGLAAEGTNPEKFSLTTGSVLANSGAASLFTLANQTTTSHVSGLTAWIDEAKNLRDHTDSAGFYLFDRNTRNSVLTRKVNDPTASAATEISQGNNLKKFLINASNRAMMEVKLNGSGTGRTIGANELMKASDLNSDFKLAKYFLKSMETYGNELFNGDLATNCPGPAFTAELKNVSPESATPTQKTDILKALHSCLKIIPNNDTWSKKAAINAEIASYDLAIAKLNKTTPAITVNGATGTPVSDYDAAPPRADVARAKELRKYLAALALLKCKQSSKMACTEGVTRNLGDTAGLNPVRYLISASGKALSRLSPADITSLESEETIHRNISSLCSREATPDLALPVVAVATPIPTDGHAHDHPAAPAVRIPATLASNLGGICAAHNPIIGGPVVGNTREVSADQIALGRSRARYLEDNHVTFLPDGNIASSTPKASVGGQVAIGVARAFESTIAPTLLMIPNLQAETDREVERIKFDMTIAALTQQNADYFNSHGGFFGFGPTQPFAGAGIPGGFGFGGGFSAAGFDSGYASYLGSN